MIEKVRAGNCGSIANPAFRTYAKAYIEIERQFRESVELLGLPFETGVRECVDEHRDAGSVGCVREGLPVLSEGLARHLGHGLEILNDGKSYVAGWQSSACVNCRLGLRAKTFLLSTQCPRECFFCFNVNQEGSDELREGIRDAAGELEQMHERGVKLSHIALTGGEPLMHRGEALEFLLLARELYPDAHTRLYTSGAFLDEALMVDLRATGLSEIRFSIKTDDEPSAIDGLIGKIGRTATYIRDVMVEMPVIPGELELMKKLLVKLDEAGVRGVNLLELGYPFANAGEFAKRGLRIKAEPMRVLYDYRYAGGLPIAGSEEECLRLLEFALDEGLRMGVHYCSMENKSTGQVFQQNALHASKFPTFAISGKDHFLKAAKVFGEDVPKVLELFASELVEAIRFDDAYDLLEFPPMYISELREAFPDMEVALCYSIVEVRDGEPVLRELRIDRTTPATFDLDTDF